MHIHIPKMPSSIDEATELASKMAHALWMKMPIAQQLILDALELLLMPRQALRMLVVASGLQVVLVVSWGVGMLISDTIERFTKKGQARRAIVERMNNALTFTSWRRAAQDLDKLNGVDEWRTIDECAFYDHRLIRKRIQDINTLMRKGDVFDLMFKFRGGLSRDQFGVQHEGLFSKCAAGTKELVEEYHDTVSQALEFIAESPPNDDVSNDYI
jgi:hypothetical protein